MNHILTSKFLGHAASRPKPPPTLLADKLLKKTTSRCPVCNAACPGEVWRVGGMPARVMLKRNCAQHGEASVCIASDARFYWLSKGKPENANGRGGCGHGSAASDA